MSSADDSGGPEHETFPPSIRGLPFRTDTLLVETLVHALIEKGILTKNDALSVIQTVAQVRRGTIGESSIPDAAAEMEIHVLRRMYESFEALGGRSSNLSREGDNVYPLRPPVHGDHPDFPDED